MTDTNVTIYTDIPNIGLVGFRCANVDDALAQIRQASNILGGCLILDNIAIRRSDQLIDGQTYRFAGGHPNGKLVITIVHLASRCTES